MSHYGIEGDRLLAKEMPSDIKADIILGGHSHIRMENAETVNNTLIVQSCYGMTHIGRLDLDVDSENGGIVGYDWKLVRLDDRLCDFDAEADKYVDNVLFDKNALKEDLQICRLAQRYEHKSRLKETALGDLIADAFLDMYKPNFVILQSGSIRLKSCGPNVTLETLKKLYPYDDSFVNVSLTGKEIRQAFEYLFSLKPDGTVMSSTFQYSKGFHLIADLKDYKKQGCRIVYMGINGEEPDDGRTYTVGMTKNCMNKFLRYFGFSLSEKPHSLVSVSTFSDLARWMITQNETVTVDSGGRFEILNGDDLP